MNKNLQSPTKLTEFAPIQTEEKHQSVGQLITKIFKLNKTPTTPSDQNSSNFENDSPSQESVPTWAIDSTAVPSPAEASPVYKVDVNEERSLPNVLKRISNLLALKSNSLQDYSKTELKQYWMPDPVSRECYECCEKFTTFRRKHHCRVCGQIFCSNCCSKKISGRFFGCTGDLRVCTYCYKVFHSYLESSDVVEGATDSVLLSQDSTLQEADQIQNLNTYNFSEINTYFKRKVSVGYQEENFAATGNTPQQSNRYLSTEEVCKALQNSLSLRTLSDEMSNSVAGLALGTHKYRLRTYTECFLGSELVDWLICQQKANSRVQAAAISQALLEGGYIECVSDTSSFIDGFALYKFVFHHPSQASTMHQFVDMPNSHQDEPIWVQQIPHESSTTDSENEYLVKNLDQMTSSSSYTLNINLEANAVYLSRPLVPVPDVTSTTNVITCTESDVAVRTSEQRDLGPESGWHHASSLREENGEKLAYKLLSETYRQHELSLLKQLLAMNCISLSWTDIILPLCHEVIDVIRPDKNHNATDLDVRHYIKFKKLPRGPRTDTKLIQGLVCSKNVAHRGMATEIDNPKILFLECSVVYQRTEGRRFMSLEPVLMQEPEYFRHVVGRIVALEPDVVLVQRNVSRLAQDLLRQDGITLVYNVKQTILDQLARCTEADLVTAVDSHIGRPRLGSCQKFYLKTFNIDGGETKTCMFFEGLPLAHLGATIMLRGGSRKELAIIKDVMSFFLFASYNWRLEKSFLMDEFAEVPNSDFLLLDDESWSNIKNNSITENSTNSNSYNKDDVKDLKISSVNSNCGKILAVESVDDFTDPLQSHNRPIEGNEKLFVAELPFSNNFRKSLDDTVLAISPFIQFSLPYLETESGKKCKLRKFFPSEIYLSEQFTSYDYNKTKKGKHEDDVIIVKEKHKPLHPFLATKFTSNVDNNDIQRMLSNFRACGGKYPKKEIFCKKLANEDSDYIASKVSYNKQDVFEIRNHQRLSVLFCSFSHESTNSPAFCVNPWIVNMTFYGTNDIPLGCFLERYCFRATYNCPSKTCDVPMLKHIRRFVHNSGCVSISLNNFENGFIEDGIVMWTWCVKCQTASPVVLMSADTWSFSFAKYLELKFYGGLYTRRGNSQCKHSLHHYHYQYFGYKNVVASFKYTSIQIWDIILPSLIIEINYTMDVYRTEMIDETRTMAQKGHEVYSLTLEKLSLLGNIELEGLGNLKQLLINEQLQFKKKVDQVQLKLTSPTIENKQITEDVHIAFWKITDSLTRIKRTIVDAVDIWNTRLQEAAIRRKDIDKKNTIKGPELESPLREANNCSDVPHLAQVGSKSLDQTETGDVIEEEEMYSPKCHQRSQSDGTVMSSHVDVEPTDTKKSVKNILSQLLPPSSSALSTVANPFNIQEHYTLPTGIYLPIVVYESEPSSIIAYSLNSYDYKKSFEELCVKKSSTEQSTPSPITKRKSNQYMNTPIEPNSGQQEVSPSSTHDDSKKTAKNQHIEIQFQDSHCNFFCRVYFADKFCNLRTSVLPIGEEAYIRSLARSVQWNARGGKSGSNFSKTTDDRFILKEIPKSEVQLFLEFAQNYFSYMCKCQATGQPTLLGKIVGIYQIIFKNNTTNVSLRNNMLVMENLFYNRTVDQKFDLKGSVRNRLVIPDINQDGETVLLDENLLKMTSEAPLYILPHSKAVLAAAIQNDTEFLSAQTVMDYSLLVGLDSENKELVLGIIDYIRTFTWDKKLETMVKKSGILGGQGKLPTIVSPQEYQKRFIEAMHRYFLEVPDHWAGLGKGLEF